MGTNSKDASLWGCFSTMENSLPLKSMKKAGLKSTAELPVSRATYYLIHSARESYQNLISHGPFPSSTLDRKL